MQRRRWPRSPVGGQTLGAHSCLGSGMSRLGGQEDDRLWQRVFNATGPPCRPVLSFPIAGNANFIAEGFQWRFLSGRGNESLAAVCYVRTRSRLLRL